MAPVTIKVEDHNEDITLDLSQEQFERIQHDTDYLRQLVDNYYNHQSGNSQDLDQEHQTIASSSNQNEQDHPNLFLWDEAGILLLLSFYEENKEDFSRKRHKMVYNTIARRIKEINSVFEVTGGQCQSKINSLKKHYKKIKDHNNKSGNDPITWAYYDVSELNISMLVPVMPYMNENFILNVEY